MQRASPGADKTVGGQIRPEWQFIWSKVDLRDNCCENQALAAENCCDIVVCKNLLSLKSVCIKVYWLEKVNYYSLRFMPTLLKDIGRLRIILVVIRV